MHVIRAVEFSAARMYNDRSRDLDESCYEV